MLKFLFTFLAVVFLLRILVKMLAGAVQIKVVKNYYQAPPDDLKNRKPEGHVTISETADNKKTKYAPDEGEYVNYEEVK